MFAWFCRSWDEVSLWCRHRRYWYLCDVCYPHGGPSVDPGCRRDGR